MTDERDWLAVRIDAHRTHVRAVAYRILAPRVKLTTPGQEAWVRISGSDDSCLENLAGWPTQVIGTVG
jgi:RNA polymerase sigma-70 factor, ECF subfamily